MGRSPETPEPQGEIAKRGPLTATEVYKAFREGEDIDVRDLARPHRAKAIRTLSRLCNSKQPPSVQATAAKSLLEFSDGRPSQIEAVKHEAGITINIMRLYAGGPSETRVIEAVDVAASEVGEIVDAVVPIVNAPRLTKPKDDE